MKRRRAPGGGRKPQGPFKENKAALSIRVNLGTRRALEASAKENRRSLSQEAQSRLRESLFRDRNTRPDIVALTEAMAIVIGYVESFTEMKWSDSAFTTTAIRRAVDALLGYWGNPGVPKIPVAIKNRMTEQKRGERNASVNFSKPVEVGDFWASQLIFQIESRGAFEDGGDPLEWDVPGWVPPTWKRHRRILRTLGSR